LSGGRVTSKREAAEWALRTLDDEWRSLIERALADRPHAVGRVREPAEPEAVRRIQAFANYVVRLSP
jgi:hypothetical protein